MHTKLTQLHQPLPGTIQIPAIIQFSQACHECKRAWPCPTYEIAAQHEPDNTDAIIIETLRTAADEIDTISKSIGHLGYGPDHIKGLQHAIRYLTIEAAHIEDNQKQDETR